MTIRFEVRSDLAVVAYNPEMADLDCPNGEVIEERFYMLAVAEDGSTRQWGWFETVDELEVRFVHVAPPVEEWHDSRPIYGSPAWVYQDQDFEDLQSEMMADENNYGRFDRVYY
jgi:hypothetical protein